MSAIETVTIPPAQNKLPGLALAFAVAAVAFGLGKLLPLVGGAVFGIVLGLVVRHFAPPAASFQPGIRFASKQILQWSIIALGFGLSLTQVAHTGLESLSVTVTTVAAAGISAFVLGKVLRVHDKLRLLIGVGTAICGGSAIAAVVPILKPDEHDTAFAISTIFLFNLVAVLLFPALGHLLHLSDLGFGLWAGTAINDTSSVVAAGYSFSHAAGDYATIVKLTRATLIIPICLVLALIVGWKEKRSGRSDFSLRSIFPWFILWFLVASAVRTAGLVPEVALPWVHFAAECLIIVALTSIGLSADLRRMASTGPRPILLGLGVWASVAVTSLIVQYLIGRL
ncbi:putative integral membrane protein (TIGR00698 family) [Luteibacter rhizovicinus]|uniref:Putative integral membrane protein (TIGR00698 family) n=1 Tax=Luteibacter rhizovicinus TaxID=242606 RepID=A0A4R3YNZ2_9GAMM|nr:YeiH family protein [Luteibacter rhizovicinus]TCV94070.1 putative integral membrane protein (TIGR00698 family) [Luteibacter rhizovicinus]